MYIDLGLDLLEMLYIETLQEDKNLIFVDEIDIGEMNHLEND